MMHGWKTWLGCGIVSILGIYSIVTGFVNVGVLLISIGILSVGIGHKLDRIIDKLEK